MELLQERIKDPGPPPQQPLGPKNGVPNGHGEEVPQVPRGEKGRNSRENENPMKNNPKYFNTNFAQFDAICGGEQQQSKYERVPMSQCQQSNYQRPGKTRESQAQTQGTGVNTVRMENGTLNIHIPCAYTYPYMPRPLPPPNECPIEETSKPVVIHVNNSVVRVRVLYLILFYFCRKRNPKIQGRAQMVRCHKILDQDPGPLAKLVVIHMSLVRLAHLHFVPRSTLLEGLQIRVSSSHALHLIVVSDILF